MFFDNCVLELWEYKEDESDFNVYGEPLVEYNLIGEFSADLQVASTSEQLKEYGEIRTDMFKAYLKVDTPVSKTMKVRVKGGSDTFEVIGYPIINIGS